MQVTPYLRILNYYSDYYHTLYSIYGDHFPAYFVDYYSLDFDNSVMDREYLHAATYEKYGLGELTGARWKKILMLPCYSVEQINPKNDASEKGVTSVNTEAQIAFPSNYGISPNEWDFVHFHQAFMTPQSPHDVSPLFIVKNVSMSTIGRLTHYQMGLEQLSVDDRIRVEQQISHHFMFVEYTKRIHDIDTASLLLKIQKNSTDLSEILHDKIDNIGFYLQKKVT